MILLSLHLTKSSQQTSRLESSLSSPSTYINVVKFRLLYTAYNFFVKQFCLLIFFMMYNYQLQDPRGISSADFAAT